MSTSRQRAGGHGRLQRRGYILGALVCALLTCCLSTVTHALPRYALLTGTRCSGCHFNPSGSSLRTDLGYSTMNMTGAFTLTELGMEWLEAGSTNSVGDGLLTFGVDVRMQVAKLGRPPADVRKVIPMQVAPSMALTPTEGLSLYGTYNAGPLRYGGQTSFDVALQYQPDIFAPSIRAGHIQPSIGLRYDDHTMFVRRDAAGTGQPIIPPNYNELGVELAYEGLRWLTVNVGAFSAHNLALADPSVNPDQLSFAGRVMLWPQLLEEGINGELGASIYVNNRFRMVNAFAGAALVDQVSLQGELMLAVNADDRTVRNVSVLGSYQFFPWLVLNGRYELGTTSVPGQSDRAARAGVVGVEFFPVPLLELRPEYRYTITDTYILAQYALQVHAFF